jgi:hypothetical protein
MISDLSRHRIHARDIAVFARLSCSYSRAGRRLKGKAHHRATDAAEEKAEGDKN